MGRSQRSKGARIELEIVHLHQDAGIAAERVPLSGASGGSFAGDVRIADQFRAEVKARGNGEGFAMLERWLGTNDVLFLRRDRRKPLVVLPWERYIALLKDAMREVRPIEVFRHRDGFLGHAQEIPVEMYPSVVELCYAHSLALEAMCGWAMHAASDSDIRVQKITLRPVVEPHVGTLVMDIEVTGTADQHEAYWQRLDEVHTLLKAAFSAHDTGFVDGVLFAVSPAWSTPPDPLPGGANITSVA